MENILNEKFKTKTKQGIETANYHHAINFIKLLRGHANGVTNQKEYTNEYLNKFFRSNKTRNEVIKVLKEAGIIEVTKSYVTKVKGKEYRLHNDYLPDNLKSKYMIDPFNLDNELKCNPNGSVDEETFFKAPAGPEGFVKMFGEPAIEEKPKTIKINYRGFSEVEIDNVSTEDIKLFKEKINQLKEQGIEPSESIIIDLNLWSKEKSWFIYDKWRNKYGY